MESEIDRENLNKYVNYLHDLGYEGSGEMGFGSPKTAIVEKATAFNADLLVMGAHGHRLLKDILFGTTVDAVRHALKIPVLIVR